MSPFHDPVTWYIIPGRKSHRGTTKTKGIVRGGLVRVASVCDSYCELLEQTRLKKGPFISSYLSTNSYENWLALWVNYSSSVPSLPLSSL